MKRAGLWVIGIGMLFIVGILTVKQGYAQECSLATVQGTYLFAGISYQVTTDPQVSVYIAVAGRSIYDGNGHSHTLAKLTVNGVLQPDSIADGEYTVEPDCTGTETIPDHDPNVPPHTYATVIDPHGREIVILGTDPGTVRANVSKRVAR